MIKLSFLCLAIAVFGFVITHTLQAKPRLASSRSFYDLSVKTIDGKSCELSAYKGKVILIVNVASKCGFTSQYKGLEILYKTYKDQGFVILGFPSNDFAWQEPASNAEIAAFCHATYNVSFPMFSKIETSGKNADPLYTFLTKKETNPVCPGRITWNFNKFLIDRNGKIITRFGSKKEPLDSEVIRGIETALNTKATI